MYGDVVLGYLYARQSHDNRGSIEQQLALGRAWFGQEGIQIAGTYQDGSSASRFASQGRDDWAQLLQALKALTEPATLWLWESSRGDRTLASWAAFLDLCREKSVMIHVDKDGRTYNMRRSRDWKTLAEDGVSNAYTSEETSERVLRGVTARATAGRPHGRNLYGYVRNYHPLTGRLESVTTDPAKASVVQECARRVLASETLFAIAADLTRRGVPTPHAGMWSALKLKRVLMTPRPAGASPLDEALAVTERRWRAGEPLGPLARELNSRGIAPPAESWNPTQVKSLVLNPAYTGRRYLNGQDIGPAMWPAILDAAALARVQAILGDPRRSTTRESAVRHLLTGIARCGIPDCGGRMRVRPNGNSPQVYSCAACGGTARRQFLVDRLVEETLWAFLARPDAAEILAAADGDDTVQAAFAEITELQTRLDGFYDEASAGRLSPAGLARVETRLLAEIGAAKQRTQRTAVTSVVSEVIGPDPEKRWKALSVPQRRAVVTALVSVAISPQGKGSKPFDPETVHIVWRHASRG